MGFVFDGDILNIIGLMNKAFVFMFRKYDPVMRMIISRDSRLINEYFSINKGQLIDLYTFATYDGEEGCNTEETYPDEETIQKDKFNLLTDSPVINNTKELKAWLKDVYVLDDYLESYEQYRIFQTKIYNILKGCFVIPQCRDYPIKFKFTANSKEYVLPLRLFIINTILWYPFVELHGMNVLDESFIIFNPEVLPSIENYLNDNLISILSEYHVKSSKMNYAISEVLFNLRNISNDYSIILGLDFSIPMFTKLYSENDRIREIMECHFEDNAQPHEIEQELGVLEKEFINIITGMKDNHLGIALRAQTGIKHKQLTEFAISEGLKPDISGRTIPIPIQSSTLIGGTNTPSAQYIDAAAARKSLIMNKKVMGTAGHFGKTVLMSARTLSMSNEVSDCGTKHLVAYDVLNKTILKKLTGKFYKLTDDPDEELKLLNSKKDKDLIGKTIYVRSAATCACKNPHHVCAKCVGMTAVINADISDGISAFESEEITKVVNQNILSAKHLLSTNSEEIRFNKEFYDFFTILGGEINPIVNDNQNVNIKDYAIYVDPSDISKIEELDDDSLYNTVIETGRFFIRNIKDPSEPDIIIQIDGEKEIYVTEEASMMLKSGNNMIMFSDLEDDDKLFEVVIMNNELTKPLYGLMHLLDKQSDDMINNTIDYISNKFLSLVIEAKIDVSAIACELIINRLIRSAEDIYKRPDFSKDNLEPYVIFTVRKSLEKNPSPLVGIGFQNIKRQLLSNDLFEKRTETSYIDNFFKPVISTENLSKYEIYANNKSLDTPK